MRTKQRLFILLTVLLVVSALLVPMTTFADQGWGNWYKANGQMLIPAGATASYSLSVGPVKIVVPPGALPDGGPVILRVRWNSNGDFIADFLPDHVFAAPVMMDFGSGDVVYYHSRSGLVPIRTQDLDGDGAPGEIHCNHFSRFSGW